MQDNLKIIDFCIQETYMSKKELYVLAIDFRKAFDSVDRRMLIMILKELKIDPRIIQVIYNVYNEDVTKLILDREELDEIEVSNGIRQGCSCSALLFVIVTYKIIKEIQISKKGYRDQDFYIPCIFYADDGLILGRSREEICKMMEILERSAGSCGLKLNRGKCQILVYNRIE